MTERLTEEKCQKMRVQAHGETNRDTNKEPPVGNVGKKRKGTRCGPIRGYTWLGMTQRTGKRIDF